MHFRSIRLRTMAWAIAILAEYRARAVSQITCKVPSVTWYDDDQGLNPCQQYETLRRQCDSSYEVPVMRTDTPGDQCDTQLKDCCCNSIAFALSMLCLNCQQGVGTGKPGDTGYDAGKGAYQIYLNGCGAGTNQSLPSTVQAAVCRNGPHLKKALYELFWGTGDWYLEYTRQRIELEAAAGTDDPGKCTSTSTQTSTSTAPAVPSPTSHVAPPPSSASTSPQAAETQPAKSSTNSAVTAGAIGGGVALLVVAIAALLYALKRRMRSRSAPHGPPDIHPFPVRDAPDGRTTTGTSAWSLTAPPLSSHAPSAWDSHTASLAYHARPLSMAPSTSPPDYLQASSDARVSPFSSAPSQDRVDGMRDAKIVM